MHKSKMKVGITGAAGYFGKKIIERLEKNNEIEKIVGISRREFKHNYRKLEYHRMDVRNKKLGKLFKGVDAIIHLAFVLNPIHNEKEMHDINVGGAKNVLEVVEKNGVEKIIITSSTMVYGAWPDNPLLLHEESPLRGHPTYYYNRDKIEIERLCKEFEKENKVSMVILRPCLVLGPTVDHFYSRLLDWRWLPLVDGENPEMQFVHEEDIARAYEFFLMNNFDGVFNIVGRGTMKWKDILDTAGIKAVKMPSAVMRPIMSFLWKFRLIEFPPQILDFIKYRWVASGEKAKRIGFDAKYSTKECLIDFLKSRNKI